MFLSLCFFAGAILMLSEESRLGECDEFCVLYSGWKIIMLISLPDLRRPPTPPPMKLLSATSKNNAMPPKVNFSWKLYQSKTVCSQVLFSDRSC